ncbi:MAG: c-type cytochrome [Betaproteobacteria bacterium]|nr:c-type cytochrome [Betaproteobacteria bacterium]
MRRASLIAAVFAAASPSVLAQETTQRGQELYATQCATCHTERLHQREKSNIRTRADLRAEVTRWSRETRQRFSAEDIEDVVRYLDRSHYRLKK